MEDDFEKEEWEGITMCKQHNPRVIDKCMIYLLGNISTALRRQIKIVACCCGHSKYPMSIIMTDGKTIKEIVSDKIIPRKKRFYKKDKQGYYYIPETIR
jgi:hypothetical protein